MIKKVQFAENPPEVRVIPIGNGTHARVEISNNVYTDIDSEENTIYFADLYILENVKYTPNLENRILTQKESWMKKASITLPVNPTLQDAIDAINALTEIVLGDE